MDLFDTDDVSLAYNTFSRAFVVRPTESSMTDVSLTLNITGRNNGLIPIVTNPFNKIVSLNSPTKNKLMVEEIFQGANMTFSAECW